MNTGESLISIGALIVFSLVSLNFNSSLLNNTTVEIENKVYLTAFSLADDLIEEIRQKAFDAATVEFPTTNTASLTSAYSLGHRSDEIYPNFNDVDDFNDFNKTVSAPHAENYQVTCKVYYVDGDNPDNIVWTQTFYKKVIITVSSPYLRHSVQLSQIITLK
ncbi:hypothetical protein LJE86_10440 [bacterium BMS3Abin03]|nr:hypothetical protein [bacterium BMS3Abin03]MCG6960614.1 hypothetical protein [bacterium BMS3Abin03]